jgi:PAS domain S-box-containing protein
MKGKTISILVIEDNPGDARLIQEMLSEGGDKRFEVEVVGRLAAGLEHLKRGDVDVVLVDVVLLDLGLPDSQGIYTLLRVHERVPSIPIVVLTGLSDEELALRAVQLGAQDYLIKGRVDANLLAHSIYYAVERKRMEQELWEKKEQLEAQNDELRAVNEKLQSTEAELRASNDELQAANEELRCEIAERQQVEAQLQQSEKKYSTLVEQGDDGIIIIQDGVLKFANSKMVELIGFSLEKALGRSFVDFVSPEKRGLVAGRYKRRVSGGDIPSKYEIEILGKGGGRIPVEVSASSIEYEGRPADMAIVRDITERKQMEQRLIITDRLASVGELASGIAHELNNPLTSVIGFSQLLLDKGVPDDITEEVRIISNEAQRAAVVVKNLLTFARKHGPAKQLVNISEVIEKVLELRAYEQRVNNIRVKTQFAADLPEVMADYFQLQQVFLNIVINAEYFMIELHGKGTLTITTEKIDNVVRASFADDGPGISEENLRHLFDPFFTTKEVGKGTGLGLSICHGIVAEHGGRIYAESEPGEGAIFRVELPITAQ